MGHDQLFVDHGAQIVGSKALDLGDLVRSAETVEEVHEGNARFKGGRGGDEGHVHDFLDRTGGQHAETGGAGGHDVAVIAEDGERVGGEGARRDMEHGGGELAGDLKHVGDHQEQALRCREGSCQRAGLQRAVDGSGGAAFALHLDHRRHGAPDVGFSAGGPLVRPFPHVG